MHAFVLAGGAARGAYGAGVMRYIFTELPKNLGGLLGLILSAARV